MSAVNRDLAQAIAAVRGRMGCGALGRVLGCADTTILRRGDDVADWPAHHLLALADADEGVRQALLARLGAHASCGEPEVQAMGAIAGAGEVVMHLTLALSDRHISPAEARTSLPAVRAEIEKLTRLSKGLARLAGET